MPRLPSRVANGWLMCGAEYFVVHQIKTWGHTSVQLAYAVASVSHMLLDLEDTDGRCWYGEAGRGRVGFTAQYVLDWMGYFVFHCVALPIY